MRTEAHHENILLNTATLLLKDLNAGFTILQSLNQKGRGPLCANYTTVLRLGGGAPWYVRKSCVWIRK